MTGIVTSIQTWWLWLLIHLGWQWQDQTLDTTECIQRLELFKTLADEPTPPLVEYVRKVKPKVDPAVGGFVSFPLRESQPSLRNFCLPITFQPMQVPVSFLSVEPMTSSESHGIAVVSGALSAHKPAAVLSPGWMVWTYPDPVRAEVLPEEVLTAQSCFMDFQQLAA